jgi:hypothetical protein
LETFVNDVTTPSDNSNHNDFDHARSELREGIEHSRDIVRQSRLLIELSEADGAACANDNGEQDCGLAN